ncbi:hypothetical protein OIU85_002293 [Salix viminalis]|uniref:Alcohol dehydrogenase-like C-terminal domain-containing protein n=1 Tax=Salix viminalis TaxID=40686 RepID=A0A9Q0VNK2_SALVM|nr:hypothetical protein OIU85_002293 [Salix viminalis]
MLGVVGLGGLGHLAVKFAKAFGMKVTVISTSPSKQSEATQQLGADSFIFSHDSKQMEAAVGTMNGIIDTVSAVHPLKPLLDLLKTKGKLIMVGAQSLEKAPGGACYAAPRKKGSVWKHGGGDKGDARND